MQEDERLDLILGHVGDAKLPLPSLPEEIVNSLILLFIKGYRHAKSKYPIKLLSLGEEDVSFRLKLSLQLIRRKIPEFKRYFGEISTELPRCNFDFSNCKVRPDFTIGLTDSSRLDFPILVEAKIIDGTGVDAMREYCRKGIKRYLDGIYAWESKEGFMIAFVRNKYKLAGDFNNYLTGDNPPRYNRWKFIPKPDALNFNSKYSHFASSTHDLFSSYFHDPAISPGPIKICHIWLE